MGTTAAGTAPWTSRPPRTSAAHGPPPSGARLPTPPQPKQPRRSEGVRGDPAPGGQREGARPCRRPPGKARSEPGHPSPQHCSGPRPTHGLRSHQASAQGHVPTVGLGLGLVPELLDPGQQAGEVGGAHGHPSHLAGACGDRGTSHTGPRRLPFRPRALRTEPCAPPDLMGGGKLKAKLWDLPQESAPEPR